MKELIQQLYKAYWNLNYRDFCKKTGFEDSDYAKEKFKTFQKAVDLLGQFDLETLEKIIQP